jgi:hypothetical protein
MVMVQLGVDIDAANGQLRAYAIATNQRLVDVAHEVVARRLTFPVPPDTAQ